MNQNFDDPNGDADMRNLPPPPPVSGEDNRRLMETTAQGNMDTVYTLIVRPRFKDTPVRQIRRKNLSEMRKLQMTTTEDLIQLFKTSDSGISHMLSVTNPSRPINTDQARAFEAYYDLPLGYLDEPHTDYTVPQPKRIVAPQTQVVYKDNTPTFIAALATVLKSIDGRDVSPKSIVRIVEMVIEDAKEHGFSVRESYVSNLVKTVLGD